VLIDPETRLKKALIKSFISAFFALLK